MRVGLRYGKTFFSHRNDSTTAAKSQPLRRLFQMQSGATQDEGSSLVLLFNGGVDF